ncbi:PPR domain-containing protein/PPR_2 domain-containing protein, partial [Cephalotus follicularis]
QLHSYIIKSGFGSNVFVSAAMVRFYRGTESLVDAYKVLVEIPQPSVISWNTLISGFVQSGKFRKALGLFLELERSVVCANAYSFTAALGACGKLSLLQLGRSIHAKIVKNGLECGNVVENCLVDMYGKCGSVEEAIWVFDDMIDRDIISWNSAIAAYVNRNSAEEGLEFFRKMHVMDMQMDLFTFSIILSGVASLAALTWGVMIHCCTVKHGLNSSIVVGSALIDMYSKCGLMKDAESIFQSLPKKNLVTWNAMISGYVQNGNSTKVIQLFEQLKILKDLKPDEVSFLNVLAACSNNEMSQKAMCYFESMVKDYGIEPSVEHCCTMIRLMGQRGEVWRAVRMTHELGFGSIGVVWRTLLGACGTCRDLKVAKIAAAKLIELEGDDDYVYVMLANIFACYGKWGDVNVVRKLMREKGVRKEVGCSW